MAKEQETALDNLDTSEAEESSEEQIDHMGTIRQVLDARDFIEPVQEVKDESEVSTEQPNSDGSEGSTEKEIELSLEEVDFLLDNNRTITEKEIPVEDQAAITDGEPEPEDPADDIPDENDDPVDADAASGEVDNAGQEPAANDDSETLTAEHPPDAAQKGQDLDVLPEAVASASDSPPKDKLQPEPSDENIENEFVGLNQDELDAKPAKGKKPETKVDLPPKLDDDPPEKVTAKKVESAVLPVDNKQKEPSEKPTKKPGTASTSNRPSMINKMIGFALVVLVIAGFIFYNDPTLIGLRKATEPAPPPVDNTVQPVQPASPEAVKTPSPSSPHDNFAAKLEEATDLRNQLLAKKEDIYKLNLYYRNGIAELEESVYQEAQKEGIKSFEQALKNKRIELNLRTIQRRRAYIGELEKPARWVESGSETLLYLIRKAQLDMELIDIAGGIDLNKHKRHISAAVNQYQPSAEKLTIDLQEDKLTSLETIWQQAASKKSANEQISLNPKEEQIASEICSGNFGRIAELTRISLETAGCLSRMKGAELFLNGVTKISPDAAKELFQWHGNWVCLNGIKELSPAVAQYLFKWDGNWISLNGLTEFQPEMASYLLKWEGQQLELMGLKYHGKDAEQKTLKYLALWETTGGKLFVPDEIRKEMGRIALSQPQ